MPSLEATQGYQRGQPPFQHSPLGVGINEDAPYTSEPGEVRNPFQAPVAAAAAAAATGVGPEIETSVLGFGSLNQASSILSPSRVSVLQHSGDSYAWSYFSGFRNRWVEREFRQFMRPPAFTFTSLCLLTLVMGGIGILVTPPYNTLIDDIKIGIQWVLFGIGVIVTALDILLLVLAAQRKVSRLHHSGLHVYLRAAATWMLLVAKLTWSLQFWECPLTPDPSLRVYCFGSLSSGHVAMYFMAVLLHIPLPNYLFIFIVDTVVEFILGEINELKGQPVEAQFSRPLVAACLGCITFAITVWNEREYRNRFLDGKSLELERALNKRRKREVVAGLSSLCDRRDLPSLLSGVPVLYDSPDAGILITEVANYIPWRQSQRPITSVHFLGVLYDGIDAKRIEVGQPLQPSSEKNSSGSPSLGLCGVAIDRLWWKGDTYATGVGLMQRSTEAEREVLLKFAKWQLRATGIASGYLEVGMELQVRFGFGRGSCQSLQVPGATVTRFYSGNAIDRAKESCRNAPCGEVQLHRNPLLEELPSKDSSEASLNTTLDSAGRAYLMSGENKNGTPSNSQSTLGRGPQDQDPNPNPTNETVGLAAMSRNSALPLGVEVGAGQSTLDESFGVGFLPGIIPGASTSRVDPSGMGPGKFTAALPPVIEAGDLIAYLERNALVDEDDDDFSSHSAPSGSAEVDDTGEHEVPRGRAEDEMEPQEGTQRMRNRRRVQRARDDETAMDSLAKMRSFRSLSEDFERSPHGSRRGSLLKKPLPQPLHQESTSALLSYVASAIAAPVSFQYRIFLNARAIQRSPLAGGIAVAYVIFTLGIIVVEDAATTASFICAAVACTLGVLMRFCVLRFPHRAGLVLCVLGNVNAALTALISFLARPCVLNRNPDPQNLCFAFVGVLLSDGVRPALTVVIAALWGLIGFLFETNYPVGRERRRIQHIFWSLLAAVAMVVLAIDRIIKNRRSFDDFEALAVATARSTKSKEAHEKVLKMLLPPHVVPLYQQLRDDKASAAVTQRAEDVSLLTLKLNPSSRGEVGQFDLITRLLPSDCTGAGGATPTRFYLNVMGRVNEILKRSPEVSVIFTDGDTLMLGGPLQPPEVELEELPAVSRFANAPLKQLMNEKVATDVSLALLTLLSEISQLAPVTALLHRGDALTMIYGAARPMFALQSGAAEKSEWILQALFPQQMCVTEAFLRPFFENYSKLISVDGDDETLVARISRDVVERAAPMLRIGTPFRCRGKGFGVAKLYPLQRRIE